MQPNCSCLNGKPDGLLYGVSEMKFCGKGVGVKGQHASCLPAMCGSASAHWDWACAGGKTLSTIVLVLFFSIYTVWVFGCVSLKPFLFPYSGAQKGGGVKFSVKYHGAFGGRNKGSSGKPFSRNFLMRYMLSFFSFQSCWWVNTRLYGIFHLRDNPTPGIPNQHQDETTGKWNWLCTLAQHASRALWLWDGSLISYLCWLTLA